MPRQRIKLKIANIPAQTRELVPLRVNYDFLAGMPAVLVNAESLNEIMADKVLAFPTSLLDNLDRTVSLDSNKIRHRDIWDHMGITDAFRNATVYIQERELTKWIWAMARWQTTAIQRVRGLRRGMTIGRCWTCRAESRAGFAASRRSAGAGGLLT